MSNFPSEYQNMYQYPIEYAHRYALEMRRPGILTALGIISIVLGSLSVIASLGGVASGIMYLTVNRWTPGPVIVAPAPAVVAAPGTQPAGVSGAAGATAQPTWVMTPATMPNGTGTATSMSAGAGANGVVTYSYSTTATVGGGTVAMGGPGRPLGPPVGQVQMPNIFQMIPAGASELGIVEGSLSLCAAVLLLVAGVMMLRDSLTSYRLHRVYVMLKLPLIIVAAYVTWWTQSSMMNGIMATANNGGAVNMPGFGSMVAVIQAMVMSVIAMIYPVAILIVLSTKKAREWRGKL